jgi:hypothetical protein
MRGLGRLSSRTSAGILESGKSDDWLCKGGKVTGQFVISSGLEWEGEG